MKRDVWWIYEGITNGAAVTLFSAMVVVTTLGVFFRYVLNNALPWAEEADRYLFIWLSFVGASITMRRKGHIAVDLLLRYVSPAWHHRLTLLAQGCVLVFLCVVFWASLPVIELTSETRATATDIPMSWVYIAAPVGCVLIAIETLRLAARTWAEMRQGGAA
ncbi:MAG: TRAP-type C4-dicarboxylate transport system, small permease component [Holophagaceae bacterium]|jgi:TRAP-type C4-dicarboxylate transport system permease small subunit|nr:TRAP-type C4-dicarboxylate transport system, small permease component [Holophagaceae bacterium]